MRDKFKKASRREVIQAGWLNGMATVEQCRRDEICRLAFASKGRLLLKLIEGQQPGCRAFYCRRLA